jgi:type I restriction enzyme S subunit
MKQTWPIVKLGEVLTPVLRMEKVDAAKEYRLLGVRLDGQGPFLRETVTGGQTSAPRLFRVAKGDFIYSRLFACRGAFGVIGNELDGCYVSGEFPTFQPVSGKVDVEFLRYWFHVPSVIATVDADCSGSTPLTRNRFKEEFFHALEIPLPPFAEQHRIVARIKGLAAHIQEACALRLQAAEQADQIMAAAERSLWPVESLIGAKRLDEVTTYLARGRQSEQGESGHFLIKTQHVQQGRFVPTTMQLAAHVAVKVKDDAVVKDNDILIACSAAGCLGRVARYKSDGKTASTDTHVAVARPNTALVDPDYLYAYLKGAQGQHQLRCRERGDWQREKINFRLTELNLNDLRQVPVPVPSFAEQRRIVTELDTLQAQVDALKRLHAETAAELDALMPSILDRAFKGEL